MIVAGRLDGLIAALLKQVSRREPVDKLPAGAAKAG